MAGLWQTARVLNGLPRSAYRFWGELMATRARGRRSSQWIRSRCGGDRGAWLSDLQPRIIRARPGAARQSDRLRVSIEIEGVRIAPGDLIFGDREGVLVIPSEVAAEAIEAALEKASTENRVATAIRGGMGAREAFETFGVL